MNNISKAVLTKIKMAKISPIPKWRFVAIHILLWLIVFSAIIIGSIAISVIIRIIWCTEWDVVRRVGGGSVKSFMMIIPYIWFVLLCLILFLANKLFTKTKKGYRQKPVTVVLGSVIISVVFGVALYFVGAGHAVEKGLIQNIAPYAKWQQRRDRMLVAPNRGVLVGKVFKINSGVNLIIIDFKSTKWTVDITNAEFKNNFTPQVNLPVGVFGKKTSKITFKADKIFPWRSKIQRKFNGMQPIHQNFLMEMIESYK